MIKGETSEKGGWSVQKRKKIGRLLFVFILTFSVFTSCGGLVIQNPFTVANGGVFNSIPAPSLSDVIAAYDFSGNLIDSSGNGHNATNNGATFVVDRHGNTASALSFESGDYVQVGLTESLRIDEISICLWAYVKNMGGWMSLVSYGDGGHHLAVSSPEFVAGLQFGAYSFSTTQANIEEWYFVCMTRDNLGDVRIYINGDLENTINHPNPRYPFSYFWIGNCPSSGEGYEGLIDEVQIYPGPLSDGDIDKLYQQQK